MKNIPPVSLLLSNRVRLLTAALVLGALPASLVHAAPDTKPVDANLVINGSLEAPNATKDYALGWAKARGGKVSWLAEAGDHFIRLESTEPGKMVSIYHPVALQGAKAVELTVKARVTGLVRGDQSWFDARVMSNFRDAGGAEIKSASKPIAFGKDTDGWVERKVVMTVPEGAVMLAILPTLLNVNAGTMDITEVKLLAVEPPAAAPAPAAKP